MIETVLCGCFDTFVDDTGAELVCGVCPDLCSECTDASTCTACAEIPNVDPVPVGGVCSCATGYLPGVGAECIVNTTGCPGGDCSVCPNTCNACVDNGVDGNGVPVYDC